MSREIFGVSVLPCGAAIRSLRRRKGLTQQALAMYLGCSIGAVKAWEQEVNRPSLSAVHLMVELLPDSQTYMEFGLTVPTGVKLTRKRRLGKSRMADPAVLRAYRDLLVGAKILFDVAACGYTDAAAQLKTLADIVTTRGSNWSRAVKSVR